MDAEITERGVSGAAERGECVRVCDVAAAACGEAGVGGWS